MKDGSIEAVFAVGDLGEFKRFVLAFGGDCEVLEPADLRDEIIGEARKVLEREKRLGKSAHGGKFSSLADTFCPPSSVNISGQWKNPRKQRLTSGEKTHLAFHLSALS